MKYVPEPYHKVGIKHLLKNLYAGLFLVPGFGKTGITLMAYKILHEKKLVNKLTVISTKRVLDSTWPRENSKWDEFGFETLRLEGGCMKKSHGGQWLFDWDKIKLVRALLKKEAFDILFVALDSMELLIKAGYDFSTSMVALDESHKIKSSPRKSARSKFALKLSEKFGRRVILTGTPTPKHLMNIFTQIKFLDGGKALGKTRGKFEAENFTRTGFRGYTLEPIAGAEKRIMKKIKPFVLSMGDEHLPLPELIYSVREVYLPEGVIPLYREMKRKKYVEFDGKKVTAKTAAIVSMKLHQLANGFIYDQEQGSKVRNVLPLHDQKGETLADIIDELQGSPCLVGYHFAEDREIIKRFVPNAKFIDGRTPTREALEIETAWNKGSVECLAGQISTLANGLNLQDAGCTCIVYFSLTYKFDDFLQFIRRIRRLGADVKKSISVILIVTAGTQDEAIMLRLTENDCTQTKVMRALSAFQTAEAISIKNRIAVVKLLASKFGRALRFCKSSSQFNFCTRLLKYIGSWSELVVEAFLVDAGILSTEHEDLNRKILKRVIFSALGIDENSGGTFTIESTALLEEYFP